MFIDACGTGVMIENRREKPDKLIVVELRAHDIFRSFSLHETHRDQIGLADQLHEVRGILCAEVVFRYELHELAIGFFRQRPESWCMRRRPVDSTPSRSAAPVGPGPSVPEACRRRSTPGVPSRGNATALCGCAIGPEAERRD